MYIPSYNREEDRETLLAFMQEHSFATLVSHNGVEPVATHLPFSISHDGGSMYLITHMARANPQWRSFSHESDVLVIFQGPHAYISPSHYDSRVSVPTWNYIAVHAYGKVKILDPEEHDSVLRTIIDTYEPGYASQYNELPEDYLESHLKAIVALEIEVTRLEGKFKVSQDKKATERERIVESLSVSEDNTKRAVAEAMKSSPS